MASDNLASASGTGKPTKFAFNRLPLEVNQMIAIFLDDDKDIVHFKSTCQETFKAVDADKCSFWRKRFFASFDRPYKSLSDVQLKTRYISRKLALKKGARFERATNPHERNIDRCLEALRDLILDSFCGQPWNDEEVFESENMKALKFFVDNHNILDNIFNRRHSLKRDHIQLKPDCLLYTIQVLLAPCIIDIESPYPVFSYPTTQRVVYASAEERPIFIGCHETTVDMEWALHQISFWKYHMTRPEELTLFYAFNALESDETPRFWQSQLRQGCQDLGKHWKGSYSFVDRRVIGKIRRGFGEDEQIQDEFNGEVDTGAFQDLELKVNSDSYADSWPERFEEILKSLQRPVSRARTRAQQSSTPCLDPSDASTKPRSFRFAGTGHDNDEDFLADGWFNPLPPQNGIPGWQRMTMMKYYVDDHGFMDLDALWAYEGVVLPGAQIILGRWWSPEDGTGDAMYSGPFILWCVDGPKYADDQDDEVENDAELGQ